MPSRSPWLLTWVQPFAALAVVVIGLLTNDTYPAGESAETGLLVALGLVTLPGLVVAVADVVERSRGAAEGERPHYQQVLDRVVPRGDTPVLGQSLAVDVLTRLMAWGLLQSVLVIAVALVLMPFGLDESWRTLPLVVAAGALVVVLGALLVGIAALGVIVLRAGVRGAGDEPMVDVPTASDEMRARPPVMFRLTLVALGICLLGLATFGVPYVVVTIGGDLDLPGLTGAFTVDDARVRAAGVHLAWLWALRVTAGMALGGLAVVVVASPISFWLMVARPRRHPAADPAEPPSSHV